jgi:hypothetical protein
LKVVIIVDDEDGRTWEEAVVLFNGTVPESLGRVLYKFSRDSWTQGPNLNLGRPEHERVFYRVQPLLRIDREMGEYTRAVSEQWTGKHVPAATDTNAIEGLFSMSSVPRYYKQGTRVDTQCLGV